MLGQQVVGRHDDGVSGRAHLVQVATVPPHQRRAQHLGVDLVVPLASSVNVFTAPKTYTTRWEYVMQS
jgi:hypothetical protein